VLWGLILLSSAWHVTEMSSRSLLNSKWKGTLVNGVFDANRESSSTDFDLSDFSNSKLDMLTLSSSVSVGDLVRIDSISSSRSIPTKCLCSRNC
jgi:hypothetical protein